MAACLYKGLEDVHRLFGPSVDERYLDEVLYPHAKRLGTTLQVTEEMWPADRAAFEAYWKEGSSASRWTTSPARYLRTASPTSASSSRRSARSAARSRWLLRPVGELMTGGFLPPEFRDELGLPWDDRRQRRFDRVAARRRAGRAPAPAPLREFPLNLYLRDTQRRLRTGRPVI